MSAQRKGDRHKKAAILVRLEIETLNRLRLEAEARDLAMAYLVQKAVDEFLDRLIPVDEWKLTR